MHDFIMALLGGLMIGLAAVLLMATQGSIMGISGIASKLLPPVSLDWRWRFVFLAGVLAGPLVMIAISADPPEIEITPNVLLLVVSGFLVGFGTVTGNGCTSGHGVCGISRFSMRSLVATGVFMVSAIITVYVIRHVLSV